MYVMSPAVYTCRQCEQVNAWAESRNMQVLGLYHANERLDDKSFGPGPRKIADKLQQQCSPVACGLLVRCGWCCALALSIRVKAHA